MKISDLSSLPDPDQCPVDTVWCDTENTVTQLTPYGRGAVGTLLCSGSETVRRFCKNFRFVNGKILEPDRILQYTGHPVFGHFILSETEHEKVVVRIISATRLEIHAHGGDRVCCAIYRKLTSPPPDGIVASHVSLVPPPDPATCFPDLIVPTGCSSGTVRKTDLSENFHPDSLFFCSLLASAQTELCTRILLDQFDGALIQAIDKLQNDIARCRSLQTPHPDQPELISFFSDQHDAVIRQIDRLLKTGMLSPFLFEPFSTVLVGPPNVGKSSLTNRILGFDRVIVDPQSGTTRDVVSVSTILDGWGITVNDTAGIHKTTQKVEQQGITGTLHMLRRADLIIAVFDVTNTAGSVHEIIHQIPSDKTVLYVLNKCDRPETEWEPYWKTANNKNRLELSLPENFIRTSASQNQGIQNLKTSIIQKLIPVLPAPKEGVPLFDFQLASLKNIRDKITEQQYENAQNDLQKLKNQSRKYCYSHSPEDIPPLNKTFIE